MVRSPEVPRKASGAKRRGSDSLRNAAQGRPCQVRLPGVCDGGGETTVLGHIRMAGITGVGMKAPDLCAAHVCARCHDVLDGRVPSDFEREYLRMAHLEGMARTIAQLVSEGLL